MYDFFPGEKGTFYPEKKDNLHMGRKKSERIASHEWILLSNLFSVLHW